MRGRVMSLWFVAFQGSTPIGGPIIGAVMEVLGARAGLGIGAVTCIVVAAAGLLALRRVPSRAEPRGSDGAAQPVDHKAAEPLGANRTEPATAKSAEPLAAGR